MRLIDCDKLRDGLGVEVLMEEVDEDSTIDDIIANVPTVEAIPIEWLMKWEKEHTWEYESYFREIGKYAVECAIEDWRKENE